MSERRYFGTDGIRGKVGEHPISPEFVLKLGWAAGRVLANKGTKKVLIGKDTRISGYMLESALEAGFSAAGLDIGLLGPMPTPGIAYLTRTFRAEAGVVISASHNPYYDNGIKFFSSEGTKLGDELELAIEAELDKDICGIDSAAMGKAYRLDDAAGRYIEFCKSNFPSQLSLNGLKIVVDCANGATYHIAPAVYRELGAEVIEIGCDPDGMNINKECGATSMAAICNAVVEHQADLGIALDGDGDRIMMADSKGQVIDGDEIVFMIARDALKNGRLKGGVVGTVMSNIGMEKALSSLSIPFVRAKVGDRYVMELLKEKSWCIGGESSGHVINLNHTTTGDGIISSLQVLTAMLNAEMSLDELRSGYVKCPQHMINVRYTKGQDPLSAVKVQQAVADVEASLGDEGRVLLRKSGTEPVIRVMVEGSDADKIERCAQQIADQVAAAV